MLSGLIKEIAQELDINKDIVENVIKYIFVYVREQIRVLSGKNILIHHFGTFSIKKHNLKKYIEELEKQHDKGLLENKKYTNHKSNIEKLKKIQNENSY